MVRVTSEVGRLRRALVHEPGAEVDLMVPGMMEQLLFDDILYGDRAREEHARLRRVLQLLGVEVVDAAQLLAESLEDDGARSWVIQTLLGGLPTSRKQKFEAASPEQLATALISGVRASETEATGGIHADELFEISPLPNYCFQRDPQIVLRDSVLIGSMASAARQAETLLSRTIFKHHPTLASTAMMMDPVAGGSESLDLSDPTRPTLEGGDVLVLSPEIIAVGLSERTNRAGVRRLARNLARMKDGPRWLVVVDLPRKRAYMHLDTLITAVDTNLCLVHAPVILPGGVERASVSRVDLTDPDLHWEPANDLLTTLGELDLPMEPIPCGGNDAVAQQREQWTDGANAFAVSPGVIFLFDRNRRTASELERRGFEIVEAEQLLLGQRELNIEDPDVGRVCILLKSHEISRARGGPHCLIHPLVRDDL